MGTERPPIVFYAFDLLQLDGKDLKTLPSSGDRFLSFDDIRIVFDQQNGNSPPKMLKR